MQHLLKQEARMYHKLSRVLGCVAVLFLVSPAIALVLSQPGGSREGTCRLHWDGGTGFWCEGYCEDMCETKTVGNLIYCWCEGTIPTWDCSGAYEIGVGLHCYEGDCLAGQCQEAPWSGPACDCLSH